MTHTARPVCLLTGASRSIGQATAERLAATHDLIPVARSATDRERVAATCRGRGTTVRVIAADITNSLDIARVLTGVRGDVLIDNAGVATMKPFLEPPVTDTSGMLEPADAAGSIAYVVTAPPNVLVDRLEVRPISPRRKRSSFT